MPLPELEERYPGIPWREPIALTVVGEDGERTVTGLACRVCIADLGLRAQDVSAGEAEHVFDTREEFEAHFAERHLG